MSASRLLAMRRLIYLGTFFCLVVALFFLWQYRFERCPDCAVIRLADLQPQATFSAGAAWGDSPSGPKIVLRVGPGNQPAVSRLAFPALPAIHHLQVRFKIAATELIPGSEIWKDGRCIIEWRSEKGGQKLENDQFASTRYDQSSGVVTLVVRPDHPPATAVLRLENLGVSGTMEVSMFEATVLRERMIWKVGRFFLMAGWIIWVAAWIGPVGKSRILRPLLAAAVWLLMAIYFVLPGPWKMVQPLLGAPFQIGPEIENVAPARQPLKAPPTPQVSAAASTAELNPVGKIADKGDLTLRIKLYISHLRPLLHSLLLFAPTLAIACLIGGKRAAFLMVMIALGIEAAQISFGYGFDSVDAFDLLADGIGIILALITHRCLMRLKYQPLTKWLDTTSMKH